MKRRIFCIILSLAMIFTMMPAVSSASSYYNGQYDTGMCGENTTYILDKWNRTLEINGTGEVTIRPWETNNTSWYIRSLKIGAGVTRIDEYTLNRMKNLSKITVDENNAYYCSENYILYGNDKTEIVWVYNYCNELYIPENVSHIYSGALNACEELCYINVSAENPCYSAEGGVLFNKDKTELVRFPSEKNPYNEAANEWGQYVVPDSVRYIGYCAFYRSACQTVVLNSNVKQIGTMAFYNCTKLTSIINSGSVEKICDWAFEGCKNLKSITLGSNLTYIGYGAFYGCKSITEIQLPQSITEINSHMFYECTNLQSIVIPDTVKQIDDYAFGDCENLKSITLGSNLTYIGHGAFMGCKSITEIQLPQSLTEINRYTFWGCTNLQSIEIPKTVGRIRSGAFANCSSLKEIKIPEGIKWINPGCFRGCESLTKIELPSSIKRIKPRAFKDCTSLESINIPESVIEIGNRAFMNCTSLQKISLPENIEYLGNMLFWRSGLKEINLKELEATQLSDEEVWFNIPFGMFAYTPIEKVSLPENTAIIGKMAFMGCENLTSIDIPDSVGEIGSYAFEGCTKLKNIKLPKDLIDIGESSFKNCESITEISIPEYVSYISYYAFEGCSNLENINLDSAANLKRIESNSFRYCSSLSSVALPDTVRYLGYNAFEGCSNLKNVTLNNGLENIDHEAFKACSSLENIVLPDTLKSLGMGVFSYSGLKSINMDIFNKMDTDEIPGGTFSNTQLISLDVPENVRTIGYKSFEGCENLKTVNLNNTEQVNQCAFRWCSNLEYVSISEKVSLIDRYAFDIDNLKAYFEGQIPNISYDSFNQTARLKFKCKYAQKMFNSDLFIYGPAPDYLLEHEFSANGVCTECGASLDSIEQYKDSIVKYPVNKKADQYLLFEKTDDTSKEGVITGALYFNTPVTEISIPDEIDGYKVVGISDKAFCGEASLNKVTLGKYITYIGEEAFFGTGIKSIVIPDSVETVYGSAFNECENLVSMTLPITAYFEEGMWPNNLQTINYTKGTDGIGFDYEIAEVKNTPCYINRYNDMKVTFGEGIERIGEYAFYNLKGVTTYTMPASLQSIGDYAFYRNSSLENVKTSEGLVKIGYGAFAECESLESVNLPASLEEMKRNSFEGDEALVLTVVKSSYAKNAAYKYGIKHKVGAKGTVITPAPSTENPEIGDITTGFAACKAGAEVTIPVKFEANPGVASLKLNIEFDRDALELTDVTNGNVFDAESFVIDKNNIAATSALLWSNGTAKSNVTATGTLATLKFRVKKDAPLGNKEITVTYSDATDCDNRTVTFDVESGYIAVNSFIYGDIDGDDLVNIDDVTYFERYYAQWTGYRNLTEAQRGACDVNNDGEINLTDITILARNVAKWDGYGTLPYQGN